MARRTSMLAAAGCATGGYVISQAFVPSVSGPVVNGVSNLRGMAAQTAPSHGFGATLPLGLLAAGAAGTAGAVAGRSRMVRPAFDPSKQVGAMPPLGYFDPAGLCKDESAFRTYRAAEIKHGRVAMMAAVGAVIQHFVKFPGFESVPSGFAAATTAPGSYGFGFLFVIAGAAELLVWTESDDKEPGNFGDPMGLNQYTQEMREREINNGRFAMFAVIGQIVAELYTGKDAMEQFGL